MSPAPLPPLGQLLLCLLSAAFLTGAALSAEGRITRAIFTALVVATTLAAGVAAGRMLGAWA